MGLNWKQFERGVLRPALQGEPDVAIKLVGETIWHESDRLQALGQYVREDSDQVFGPGLGIASIERSTWKWMKAQKKTLYLQNRQYPELIWDLRLNVVACRLRYMLDNRPLPNNDLPSRALYWFKVYNASGVTERLAKYMKDARAIPWVEK